MVSFFEKLKKGMGVEISEIELKKMKEKSEKKPLKEEEILAEQAPVAERSAFTTGQAIPRKKKVQKIKKLKVETGSIKIEAGKVKKGEEYKSSSSPFADAREPEETAEPEEIEKPEAVKKLEEDEPSKTTSTRIAKKGFLKENLVEVALLGEEKTEKQKKPEPVSQNFALKKLGGQEGQLAVDVYQTDTELVIQSAIAGIKPDDLDISIEADSVIIRGTREHPLEKGEKNYFYQECYWGQFSRQIMLPEETDSSRAEASMKEGILIIRIPKIEREKKRKIVVRE